MLIDANGVLPLGTMCLPHEAATGGATSHSRNAGSFVNGVEVVAGTSTDQQHLELEVTNTFDLTSVSLVKQVDGEAATTPLGSSSP